MITGRAQLCLGPGWRDILRKMIIQKCPAVHFVSVTLVARFSERNIATFPLGTSLLGGYFVCLWYVSIAIHSCLCCQTFLWWPWPPLSCGTHSWSWKMGWLMGSSIHHSRYPLVGSEHGVTDLLCQLGNIIWAQAQRLHFWQDLDSHHSWKKVREGEKI